MTLNKILTLIIFGILVFILLFQSCESKEKEIVTTVDTVIINKIKKDTVIINQLIKAKERFKIVYKTRIDSVYLASPDTCKKYVQIIVDNCNHYLSQQDTIIDKQGDVINQQRELCMAQMQMIESKNDTIQTLRKKNKNKAKIIAILGAISTGFILSK